MLSRERLENTLPSERLEVFDAVSFITAIFDLKFILKYISASYQLEEMLN
jgi:hypothetical protein